MRTGEIYREEKIEEKDGHSSLSALIFHLGRKEEMELFRRNKEYDTFSTTFAR